MKKQTFNVTLQSRESANVESFAIQASNQREAIILARSESDWQTEDASKAKVSRADISDATEGVSGHLASPFADILDELARNGESLPSLAECERATMTAPSGEKPVSGRIGAGNAIPEKGEIAKNGCGFIAREKREKPEKVKSLLSLCCLRAPKAKAPKAKASGFIPPFEF